MSKKIIFIILYGILVFFQVFFIDRFEIKLELVFIPVLVLLFKNDSWNFLTYSLVLLFLSDFFRNNFVGLSLLIFLTFNSVLNQFSKIWSKELLFQLNFFVLFFIYNYFTFGILTLSTMVNLLLIFILFGLRKVLLSGFIRFN